MDQASVGRRRHVRLTFKQPVHELVTATHEVRILDLSLGGARVEHTHILRPGGMCHLRLPVRNQRVTLLCHVVWSKAVGRADGEAGGTGLLFHSGLQFASVSSDVQALLSGYLEGEGVPAGEVADVE
jgi:hypothetical protein